MAYYGLSHPIIAKLDVGKGTYADGFKCGSAIGTDINPQYNDADLYGDNVLKEAVKEFKYADVTLNVTNLPIAAATVMFGHTVDAAKKKITYNANDVANYVGYGFYVSELVDGVTSYNAAVLPKVKFAEASDSYNTKGDTIEFKTPSLAGKAMANEAGEWKIVETFDTKEAAESFIKTYLGMEQPSK